MDPVELALTRFEAGYNCCQSVFSAFAEGAGLDVETSLRVAGGFGGGMGHLGEVCGALTGAFMALGARYFDPKGDVRAEKTRAAEKVAEAARRFRATQGDCILCRDILGYDISDPEQYVKARAEGAFKKRCPDAVREAARIVKSMLEEDGAK
jgi:C_GCAxxG_C_C family probable redox protein